MTTEALVNDGAPYRCGFIIGWTIGTQDDVCGKRAVRMLTSDYWMRHQDRYAFRAVCETHLPKDDSR